MTVRRAPLSSSRHELGSNTITAALHISDGLNDYQPNVIIDLRVWKIGSVYDERGEKVGVWVGACARVQARVGGCACLNVTWYVFV